MTMVTEQSRCWKFSPKQYAIKFILKHVFKDNKNKEMSVGPMPTGEELISLNILVNTELFAQLHQ